ncbi:MAG: tetratricopeptide repeat protein [Rhizomicrobium sp.]
MNTRIALAATFVALFAAPSAQAAVSVLGGGPAQLCYQAADSGTAPEDSLIYCNIALAGGLSDADRAATYVNRGVLKMAMAKFEVRGHRLHGQPGDQRQDGRRLYRPRRDSDRGQALRRSDRQHRQGPGTRYKGAQNAYFDRAIADEALGNLQAAYDDYHQALAIAPDFTLASDQLKRFKVVEKPAAPERAMDYGFLFRERPPRAGRTTLRYNWRLPPTLPRPHNGLVTACDFARVPKALQSGHGRRAAGPAETPPSRGIRSGRPRFRSEMTIVAGRDAGVLILASCALGAM